MDFFFVNKQAQDNGDHEVHTVVCKFLPEEENRIFLGMFDNCSDAVQAAKEYYPQSNGCNFCCRECHTT